MRRWPTARWSPLPALVFWLCRLTLLEMRSRHAITLRLADSEAAMRAAQQLASMGNWRFNLDTKKSQ